MNIEKLVIDNNPGINWINMIISTQFSINPDEEITISINNSIILGKEDIVQIIDNTIEFMPDIELSVDDTISVIYYKEGE